MSEVVRNSDCWFSHAKAKFIQCAFDTAIEMLSCDLGLCYVHQLRNDMFCRSVLLKWVQISLGIYGSQLLKKLIIHICIVFILLYLSPWLI